MLHERSPHHGMSKTFHASCFSSALTDPYLKTPLGISGPNGKLADKRYNVYRNNVTVSLINALASIFPAVERLVGNDFFRAMARSHIRETPPSSPLLFEYGYDFPKFIDEYQYARSLPWLGDTARVERAWLDAYHARDARSLEPKALESVLPEKLRRLVFMAHPATRIVRSRYSAVSIFSDNREASTRTEKLDASHAENALITRPEQQVIVRHLPSDGALFIEQLLAGKTLEEAVTLALSEYPAFDLSLNLREILKAGVFTSIHDGKLP